MSTKKKNVKIPKDPAVKTPRPISEVGPKLPLYAILDIFRQQIAELAALVCRDPEDQEDARAKCKRQCAVIKEKLFQLPEWPTYYNDQKIAAWVVNRMVRVDRATGDLLRGTVTVVLTKDGVPVSTIDAYTTNNFATGSVVILRLGENGPDSRCSVLLSIVNGEII